MPRTLLTCRGFTRAVPFDRPDHALVAKQLITPCDHALMLSRALCTAIRPMRGIQTGPFSGPFSPGGKSVPKSKPQLTNRYIAPPEDGLTRYPTFRSPQVR